MAKQHSERCYCDSDAPFATCCAPYLNGQSLPPDPVALMRSRYCAFVLMNEDYLKATWHHNFRPDDLHLDPGQRWLGLKVKAHSATGDHGEVQFVARYKIQGKGHRLEEHSLFCREDGRWYYLHALET